MRAHQKRQEKAVKAKLTRFEKYVLGLEGIYPEFIITDQTSFFKLEPRVEHVNAILDEYEKIQTQVEELSELSDLQVQGDERDRFEMVFFSVVAKAKRFLISSDAIRASSPSVKEVNKAVRVAPGSCVASGRASVVGSEQLENTVTSGVQPGIERNGVNNCNVKLPVIEISKYNGEYDRWLKFRDTYESLIHQNKSLSEIQKYRYLKSYLGPNVLEIIASLELSGSNYQNAWELICDRFNNKKILVQNHARSLFNVERIHVESASALRKLADSVAKHLRALKTLGELTENIYFPFKTRFLKKDKIYFRTLQRNARQLKRWSRE